MTVEDSYNFRRVSDTLTTSGIVEPDDLRSLAAEGYDVVVNLLPDDGTRAVADEGDIVRGQGIAYVHIPVDFAEPTRADYEAFTAAMDEHAGETVHVHCAANYRVSAFYGVYAVRTGSWTREEADAFVRDLWDPGEYGPWAKLLGELRDGPDGGAR
jgi:uncharacterized protein (TIGR01244 family)